VNESDARSDIAGMNVRQDAKTTALSIIADLFHQKVQVDRVFHREREFYGECGYIVIGVSVGDTEGTVSVADADNWHLELNVSGGVSPDVTLTMRDGADRDEEFTRNAVMMLRAVESLT
jgi:hypothetical protein